MFRRERRALAHGNRKITTPPSVVPQPVEANIVEEPVSAPVKPEISEAQLAANRANAQLSTGALVQSIVDVRWRLNRFPGLESALLDLGRRQMLEIEPKLAGNPAPAFEMQVRLHFEKQSSALRMACSSRNSFISRSRRRTRRFSCSSRLRGQRQARTCRRSTG